MAITVQHFYMGGHHHEQDKRTVPLSSKLTGSYGSSSYVSDMTTLLSNKKYQEALSKEIQDLQAKPDSEGVYQNLQAKYYDEVVKCLMEYQKLFEIN